MVLHVQVYWYTLINDNFNAAPSCIQLDINECEISELGGMCNQICVNTQGSYECQCNSTGYRLSSDGFTCEGTYFDNLLCSYFFYKTRTLDCTATQKSASSILSTSYCEFYGTCSCTYTQKIVLLAPIHLFAKQIVTSLYQESLT